MTWRVLMEPAPGKLNWKEMHRGEDMEVALDRLLALFKMYIHYQAKMPELILTSDPSGQRVAVRATWEAA